MSATAEIVLERGLPASPDAERSILGAILLENGHYHEAAEKLLAEDLSLESHRRIYARMGELVGRGQAVDLVTLAEELARRKEVESVGGVAYLASLTEGLPRRISIREYVGIVQEKSKLRRVIALSDTLLRAAADQSTPADDLIAAADRDLLAITAEQANLDDTLAGQSHREMEELQAQRKGTSRAALSTGLAQLDMLCGGVQVGRLTMLGGRPRMGKSALAIQIARRCGAREIPTHIFAPEMTAGEILRRIWAAESGVAAELLQEPWRMNVAQMDAVVAAHFHVTKWPLVIDESSNLTPEQLMARTRIVKRRIGTQLLVLDYLQKMTFPGDRKYRHAEIDETLRRLTDTLKVEKIAGLVLSSLTEHRDAGQNARPTLDDFRGSGDIRYHAHVAWLLHREMDEANNAPKREAELNVAKQRGGREGICKLEFDESAVEYREPERGLYD
jgi:replicative DNA helicase